MYKVKSEFKTTFLEEDEGNILNNMANGLIVAKKHQRSSNGQFKL